MNLKGRIKRLEERIQPNKLFKPSAQLVTFTVETYNELTKQVIEKIKEFQKQGQG